MNMMCKSTMLQYTILAQLTKMKTAKFLAHHPANDLKKLVPSSRFFVSLVVPLESSIIFR